MILMQLKLKTNSGKSPLCLALQTGSYNLVRKILTIIERNGQKGGHDLIEALTEKSFKDGSTPLHMLLQNSRKCLMRKLVKTFRVVQNFVTKQTLNSIKAHEVYFLKNKQMQNVLELCIQRGHVKM